MSTSDPAPHPETADRPAEPAAPTVPDRPGPLPSPLFLLLVGMVALAGWLSWTRAEEALLGWGTSYASFLFILGGWTVCLTVQQYTRSVLAYRFGDRALRGTGYLRLNPFAFRELGAGLVLPLAFLLIGTVGLNGPAVHLDRSAPLGRARRALVALGGLLTNVVLAAGLGATVLLLVPSGAVTNNWFIVALMFLCYLNVSAVLLNLLPVPGTDTFDAITEGLDRWRPSRNTAIFGTVAVFAVVWAPPVHAVFMDGVFALFGLAGVEAVYLNWGQWMIQPWS